jgi:hypothetical protein
MFLVLLFRVLLALGVRAVAFGSEAARPAGLVWDSKIEIEPGGLSRRTTAGSLVPETIWTTHHSIEGQAKPADVRHAQQRYHASGQHVRLNDKDVSQYSRASAHGAA